MSSKTVERAIEQAKKAGAAAADAVLIESDMLEARVRGEEVDFVKQAREQTLGIRALVQGKEGMRSAVTSTSDLAPEMVDKMALETVELARATAEDPTAGLPDEPFAAGKCALKAIQYMASGFPSSPARWAPMPRWWPMRCAASWPGPRRSGWTA